MFPLIFNECHVQGKAHLNLPYDETQQDLKCSNGFKKFILVDQDKDPNKDYYKFINLTSNNSNIEVENLSPTTQTTPMVQSVQPTSSTNQAMALRPPSNIPNSSNAKYSKYPIKVFCLFCKTIATTRVEEHTDTAATYCCYCTMMTVAKKRKYFFSETFVSGQEWENLNISRTG